MNMGSFFVIFIIDKKNLNGKNYIFGIFEEKKN